MPEREPVPTPAEIEDTVAQLERLNDVKFAEALADCIMAPDPIETAAFRSEQLVVRSEAACRYLIDNVNSLIRKNTAESNGQWRHRAEHFRNRVGMERRILTAIVDGQRARRGILNSAPNPRRRALEALARRHPVEYLQLVREAEAEAVRKAQEEKDRRAQAKRDRKRREREAASAAART